MSHIYVNWPVGIYSEIRCTYTLLYTPQPSVINPTKTVDFGQQNTISVWCQHTRYIGAWYPCISLLLISMNKTDLKEPELASWPNKSCFNFISCTTEFSLHWSLQTRAAVTPQLHGLTNWRGTRRGEKAFPLPSKSIIWRTCVLLGVL